MILTNKFEVNYDYESIDQDFDIFLVEKTDKLFRYNILDLPVERFHARSVQYSFGKKALVLFDKNDISERDFRDAIAASYTDVTVQKVDVRNEDVRGQCH